MNVTWLPSLQMVVSTLADHPAGTLVFPFEPYRPVESMVGVRVDHEANPAAIHRLVFSLSDWPNYQATKGELLNIGPSDLFVGWRLNEGQSLFIEANLHAPSVESGSRNSRGGLLRLSEAGVHLTGLLDARGDAYGVRPNTLIIDPVTWQTLLPGQSFNGIMYQASWALRLRLTEREVVTVVEVVTG